MGFAKENLAVVVTVEQLLPNRSFQQEVIGFARENWMMVAMVE
jgi:hypothetical protein